VDAFSTRARIRLDGRRPALAGVIDRGADHRDSDALPAVAAPHRDAGNHPDGDIVDGRRHLRPLDD
jgi:hypothetical protein